jgi:hypothetical protein
VIVLLANVGGHGAAHSHARDLIGRH